MLTTPSLQTAALAAFSLANSHRVSLARLDGTWTIKVLS